MSQSLPVKRSRDTASPKRVDLPLRQYLPSAFEFVRLTLAFLSWEIRAHLRRPAFYVLLLLSTLVAGWNFSLLLTVLMSGHVVPLRQADDPLAQFLGPNLFLVLTLMFITPLLTMGLVAEERRRGLWELTLIAPTSAWRPILAKLIAAWLGTLCCLAPWMGCLLALRFWPGIGLEFDLGHLIGGSVGLAVVCLTLTAIGVTASAVCRSPFAAGVVAGIGMAGVLLLSLLPRLLRHWQIHEAWVTAAERWACWEHLARFSTGEIDPRLILGHLSVTLFLLWIAVQAAAVRD